MLGWGMREGRCWVEVICFPFLLYVFVFYYMFSFSDLLWNYSRELQQALRTNCQG